MRKPLATLAIATITIAAAHKSHAHGDLAHASEKHRKPNLDFVEKAFGRTGDPKKVTRTIRIEGRDTMRYSPARITVNQGDTVRIVVKNAGRQMHETVLGTMPELREHAEWMKKHPTMEHDEPYMVHVAPGQSGEMIWQFTEAGEYYFACLIPGHFEAGMFGTIVVKERPARRPAGAGPMPKPTS
jgi:uncharacterized cupredoxin-like copper-binding protein